uniref:Non-specific serine/threonine protein kinase n=1 Tax=Rhabditophanes sp. KR3021 TaxID=114890 RepID=A0AC35TZV7_9BILA
MSLNEDGNETVSDADMNDMKDMQIDNLYDDESDEDYLATKSKQLSTITEETSMINNSNLGMLDRTKSTVKSNKFPTGDSFSNSEDNSMVSETSSKSRPNSVTSFTKQGTTDSYKQSGAKYTTRSIAGSSKSTKTVEEPSNVYYSKTLPTKSSSNQKSDGTHTSSSKQKPSLFLSNEKYGASKSTSSQRNTPVESACVADKSSGTTGHTSKTSTYILDKFSENLKSDGFNSSYASGKNSKNDSRNSSTTSSTRENFQITSGPNSGNGSFKSKNTQKSEAFNESASSSTSAIKQRRIEENSIKAFNALSNSFNRNEMSVNKDGRSGNRVTFQPTHTSIYSSNSEKTTSGRQQMELASSRGTKSPSGSRLGNESPDDLVNTLMGITSVKDLPPSNLKITSGSKSGNGSFKSKNTQKSEALNESASSSTSTISQERIKENGMKALNALSNGLDRNEMSVNKDGRSGNRVTFQPTHTSIYSSNSEKTTSGRQQMELASSRGTKSPSRSRLDNESPDDLVNTLMDITSAFDTNYLMSTSVDDLPPSKALNAMDEIYDKTIESLVEFKDYIEQNEALFAMMPSHPYEFMNNVKNSDDETMTQNILPKMMFGKHSTNDTSKENKELLINTQPEDQSITMMNSAISNDSMR